VLKLFYEGGLRKPVSGFELKFVVEQQSQLHVIVHQGYRITIRIGKRYYSVPLHSTRRVNAVPHDRVGREQRFVRVDFCVITCLHRSFTHRRR